MDIQRSPEAGLVEASGELCMSHAFGNIFGKG